MEKKVTGTIVKVSILWWIKINTKPARMNSLDGALFPHMIKVSYSVNDVKYCKRKYVRAKDICPNVGDNIDVFYDMAKPSKCRISH